MTRKSKRQATPCWRGEYHDDTTRKCRRCPRCVPGYRLEKECDYGKGQPSTCVQCEALHFNSRTSNEHQCQPCEVCERLHREVAVNCTSESNAVCGACLHGYTDNTYGEGRHTRELPCYPSSSYLQPINETALHPNVTNQGSTSPQGLGLALGISIPVLLVILVIILLLWVVKRWRGKHTRHNAEGNVNIPLDPFPVQESQRP